jgi:hypothetical protein
MNNELHIKYFRQAGGCVIILGNYQWHLTVEAQVFSHTYVGFVVDKMALQYILV